MDDMQSVDRGARSKAALVAFTALVSGLLLVAAHVAIDAGMNDSTTAAETNGSTFEVTDLAGNQVWFAKPAERIVLVRGRDIHELVMLLGDEVEDKLVAWGPDIMTADKGCYDALLERYPKLADVPVLGSIYSDAVSVERVLSLEPDLVVVDTFMTDRGYKCVEKMKAVGLPVLFTQKGTDPIKGPRASLAVIGRAVGREDTAREINDFVSAEIEKVIGHVPDTLQGPAVYIECGNRGVEELGHTFGYDGNGRLVAWSAFLEQLHCQNIAKGVVRHMTPLHPEYVLKANPEVIVFTGAYWENRPGSMYLGFQIPKRVAESRLRAFTKRPGWEDLQAVQDNNVHAAFHGFCMHPDSFAALQQLAKWCYPDRFDDLHPEESLQEFYRRFMPMDTSGVWFMSLERE